MTARSSVQLKSQNVVGNLSDHCDRAVASSRPHDASWLAALHVALGTLALDLEVVR